MRIKLLTIILVLSFFMSSCAQGQPKSPNKEIGTATISNVANGKVKEIIMCVYPEGVFKACANIELSDKSSVRAYCDKDIPCNDVKIGQSVSINRGTEIGYWYISEINK